MHLERKHLHVLGSAPGPCLVPGIDNLDTYVPTQVRDVEISLHAKLNTLQTTLYTEGFAYCLILKF